MATFAVTFYVFKIDWKKATDEALDRVKIKGDNSCIIDTVTDDTENDATTELQEIKFDDEDNQLETETVDRETIK